jgi:glycosyltransferase involved in cell wall biosynthesis
MKYKISLYCPDSHILYDIRTLDQKGVGGGITSRIRIAHALAKLGHAVTLLINCPQNKTIQGVRYIHYSQCKSVDADVFIASTSGGAFDLGGLQSMQVNARLKILMLHGVPLPHQVNYQNFDFVYFPSNFVKERFCINIPLNQKQIFTSYRGVEESFFKKRNSKRDPFKLVYFGHPEKGLEDAISILRMLRKTDQRFTLHVFGGYGLWGNAQKSIPPEPGLVDYGLIGQKKLIPLLQGMGFSLNLQAIEEGFGLAVCESMKAGCIVLASRVGAFPEVIQQGYNGFLIDGLHTDLQTHQKAVKLILQLIDQPEYFEYVRKNASQTPFSWQTIAQSWQGHWDWHLNHQPTDSMGVCSKCKGALIALADGFHCVECGHYQPSLSEIALS